MVAAAVGIGTAVAGVAGSAMSSNASKSAANTQAQAADQASQLQWQQFQQMQQNLQPYMQLGSSYIPNLQAYANGPALNNVFSFNPTQQQLEQTPGYQFTLQQGLKGVDNAMSAKGLNLSGAQAKGIANYTTGLADQTYQQQYQNALQNFMTNYGVSSDQYNRLAGLVGLGQNAAAGVGNAGLQTASQAGNFLTQGANAQAAGTIGSANAINSGLGSISNGGLLYSLLQNGGGAAGSPNIYGTTQSGNPVYFQ
ncbi:hypothetical protein [Paraburkholderia sacchari]|uniref:hypothetical protein n=1 Tax=Paraburkholderia sacchari TaxID=159450 RepID=UPI003D97FD7A